MLEKSVSRKPINIENQKCTPFVKWVGGKRDVIKRYLDDLLPSDFNDYYEPFVGGGAMLFHLNHHKSFINDLNDELITTYEVINTNADELMKELDKHKEKHSSKYFYKIREMTPKNELEVASRFIYLNKTCFNGMYRVNSKGKFNVPFNGKTKDKLVLYNEKNFSNLSQFLSSVNMYNMDFEEFLDLPKKNDFVFIDSPYDYKEGTIGFDAYQKDGFGQEGQRRLASKVRELDEQGIKFMATNHDTKLIRELYQGFKIINIKTNRVISAKGDNRKGTGDEVVILNY